MFSGRTRWERSPNRLTTAWARRLAAGLACTDLTESNPTRCDFRYPRDEILRALADPRALLYSPSPKGLLQAREALAAMLEEWEGAPSVTGPVDPEALLLTSSTSEAYSWLFKLLCGPGEKVLVPRPSYPLLEFLADLEDVALEPYPLRYDGRWRIDLEALEQAIDGRVRAVVLVHPNNPTGNFVTQEEAASLGRICAARGLAIISDEVFRQYPLRVPPASLPAQAVRKAAPRADDRAGSLAEASPCLAFSLGGLSKAAGLPQVKVSWIRVGGPAAQVQEALARLEVIADTYLSVSTPAQWALPELLRLAGPVREQIRARTQANLDWIREQAVQNPSAPWSLLEPEGGWYATLRVPRLRSEEEWCLVLAEEDGVLLHPGYFFDFESEAYLVESLLPPEETFRRAAKRVLARLEGEG